ncbi:MAG: hypothetical protein MZV49_09655 [Rhodopseudomonas palustris]|nr:hypothetical protein [Rhodopseudomonas palustris]
MPVRPRHDRRSSGARSTPTTSRSEIEYILNQSDSTTLVLIEQYRDTNYYKTIQEVIPELATSEPGKPEHRTSCRTCGTSSTSGTG